MSIVKRIIDMIDGKLTEPLPCPCDCEDEKE